MEIDILNWLKKFWANRRVTGPLSADVTKQGGTVSRPGSALKIAIPKPAEIAASPTLALAVSAVLSILIYWQVFFKPARLQDYYYLARMDAFFLFRQGFSGLWWWIAGFLGLAVLYGLAWKLTQRDHGRIAWVIVLGGSLVMSFILLKMAPFDSSDLYDNIVHGRILGVYGANPFKQVGAQFTMDPFIRYMGWRNSPSAYGPLWEMIAGLTAKLAGNGIIANVEAFKALSGIFLFASSIVIALILRKIAPKYALSGTLLVAWNPIMLYESWGNGHNDMAMLFWVLLAVLAIVYSRYTLAVLFLVIGTLIKYIPVLMIPAAGMIALYHIKDWRSRIRFIVITGLIGLALIVLAYAPFWEGKDILTINRRMKMLSDTIPAFLFWVLQDKIGRQNAITRISMTAFVLTILYSLVQMFKAGDGKPWERFAQSSFNVMAFYLLFTNLWFQQWYTMWLIALAPFLKGHARRLALLFGFFALSKQFIAGPHIFWYPPLPKQPKLELLFLVGSYGLPLLYAVYVMLSQAWQFSKSAAANSERTLDQVEYGLERAVLTSAGVIVGGVDWIADRFDGRRGRRLHG
jgi:hypothetical protein